MQKEYDAAINTGLFDTVLFGYDKWVDEGKLTLSTPIDTPRKAVMRGWMLKPDSYSTLYEKLKEKNIQLVTSPKEYELMHLFPNVYHLFEADTAKMSLYSLHSKIDIDEVKKSFRRFMVKD